ncbi:MAG TPA: hypothetical protein VFC16_15275 [Nakamurella sp.]|nr:hypothetical protein [Nakamurella sp.]
MPVDRPARRARPLRPGQRVTPLARAECSRRSGHRRWPIAALTIAARLAIAATLVTALVAGCTSSPAPDPTNVPGASVPASPPSHAVEPSPAPDGWQVVTPPGMDPAVIAVSTGSVLVGGASPGDSHQPLLAVLRDDGWHDLPAEAVTGYGSMATLVSLAAGPDGAVLAMGTATGGAHLNPRRTAWIGTTTGIVEEPQSVETFGGPDAGGITGLIGGDDPLIVGTWSVGTGVIGVATWQHHDKTWAREPSPPVLAGDPEHLLTATATATAAAGDADVVIAGLETSFRSGVAHQHAVGWVSGPDHQSWTRVDLDDSDEDSAATDLACAGGSCVAVGRLGDRLAAWRVAAGAATVIPGMPDRSSDHYLAQPRVATDGTSTVISVSGADELLATTEPGTWSTMTAPAGEVRQIGLGGGRVYLLLRATDGTQQVYARPI